MRTALNLSGHIFLKKTIHMGVLTADVFQLFIKRKQLRMVTVPPRTPNKCTTAVDLRPQAGYVRIQIILLDASILPIDAVMADCRPRPRGAEL